MSQEGRIEGIKSSGLETATLMKQANGEMRKQRETIHRVQNTHNFIALEVEQSDRITRKMMW